MRVIGCKPATQAAAIIQQLAAVSIYPTYVEWEVRRSFCQGALTLLNEDDLRGAALIIDADDYRTVLARRDHVSAGDHIYIGAWELTHTDESDDYQDGGNA